MLELSIKIDNLKTELDIKNILNKTALEVHNKAVKNTGVGHYNPRTGKRGGALKQGWSISPIQQNQDEYFIKVFNYLEYGIYYEFGHRQQPGRFVPAIGRRLVKSWVEGRFPLTRAIENTEFKGEIFK